MWRLINVCTDYFNPHSRKGSDDDDDDSEDFDISIHTPARGVTGYTDAQVRAVRFQSTLPQGE